MPNVKKLAKKQQEELMRSFQRGIYVALAILVILTAAYCFYLWYSYKDVPVNTVAKQQAEARQRQTQQPGNMQLVTQDARTKQKDQILTFELLQDMARRIDELEHELERLKRRDV